MSILVGNVDRSTNVGMDIFVYNIVRITSVCICIKVLVLVFLYLYINDSANIE